VFSNHKLRVFIWYVQDVRMGCRSVLFPMHVCLLAYSKIPPQGLLALKPFWKNEGWWSSNYFLLTGDDTGVIRARSLVLCQEERKESQHLYKCNVESEVDYCFMRQ
jgi:hypothetical protein